MTDTDPTRDQRRAAYSVACRMAREFSEIATPEPAAFGLPASTTPTPATAPPIDLSDKQPDDTVETDGTDDLDGQVQQALTRMQQAVKISHTPRPKTGPTAVHFRNAPWS